MKSHRIRLYSPFSPDECVSRIRSSVDEEPKGLAFPTAYLFGTKPITGQIDGASLRLRKRGNRRGFNQIFLFAEIQPEGAGTVIVAEIGQRPSVKIFMYLWSGGLLMIAGVAFISWLVGFLVRGSMRFDDSFWGGFVLPVAMVLITQVDWFGLDRSIERKEARTIIRFLVRTLAVENPPADGEF